MKTIKDAVIELGGKWPDDRKQHLMIAGVNYFATELPMEALGVFHSQYVCTLAQFQSEAKRMGYINGYRYGVEHPTNGKRPDLLDDVLVDVSIKLDSDKWNQDCPAQVKCWDWDDVTIFRITDPRYKPADDGVACKGKNCTSNGVDAHSDDCIKEHEPVCSGVLRSWHERGELPPVGIKCQVESAHRKEFCDCKIVAIDVCDGKPVAVFSIDNYMGKIKYYSCSTADRFRPIRTEREKVVEAAKELLKSRDSGDCIFEILYNAGMLVLTPKKSDTED